MKEKIIESNFGYKIYKSDGRYFLDTYKNIIPSFETLKGAQESAYYQGYRETRE